MELGRGGRASSRPQQTSAGDTISFVVFVRLKRKTQKRLALGRQCVLWPSLGLLGHSSSLLEPTPVRVLVVLGDRHHRAHGLVLQTIENGVALAFVRVLAHPVLPVRVFSNLRRGVRRRREYGNPSLASGSGAGAGKKKKTPLDGGVLPPAPRPRPKGCFLPRPQGPCPAP